MQIRNRDLGPVAIEDLAREIHELEGEVIIGVYSDARHRPYREGQEINVLWAVPIDSSWVVTGVCGKRMYDSQIELIKRIRPEWKPKGWNSPNHGHATFFTVAPVEEAHEQRR